MVQKMKVSSGSDNSTNIFKTSDNDSAHKQYRRQLRVSEFHNDFSRKLYESIGDLDLGGYHKSSNPTHRLRIFNGLTTAEYLRSCTYSSNNPNFDLEKYRQKIEREIRAYSLDKELCKIDDYKLPKYKMAFVNDNSYWENAVREIESMATEKGWVEINNVKIFVTEV